MNADGRLARPDASRIGAALPIPLLTHDRPSEKHQPRDLLGELLDGDSRSGGSRPADGGGRHGGGPSMCLSYVRAGTAAVGGVPLGEPWWLTERAAPHPAAAPWRARALVPSGDRCRRAGGGRALRGCCRTIQGLLAFPPR